jgi:hypothetical protein
MLLAALRAPLDYLVENALEAGQRKQLVLHGIQAINDQLAGCAYTAPPVPQLTVPHIPQTCHSLLVSFDQFRGRHTQFGPIGNSVEVTRYLLDAAGVAVSPCFSGGIDSCLVRIRRMVSHTELFRFPDRLVRDGIGNVGRSDTARICSFNSVARRSRPPRHHNIDLYHGVLCHALCATDESSDPPVRLARSLGNPGKFQPTLCGRPLCCCAALSRGVIGPGCSEARNIGPKGGAYLATRHHPLPIILGNPRCILAQFGDYDDVGGVSCAAVTRARLRVGCGGGRRRFDRAGTNRCATSVNRSQPEVIEHSRDRYGDAVPQAGSDGYSIRLLGWQAGLADLFICDRQWNGQWRCTDRAINDHDGAVRQ